MEDLDRMIDEALLSYSAHAARPGLERRIMNGVRESPVRRFRWWPYVFALLMLVPRIERHQPVPSRAREQAVSQPVVAVPVKKHHLRRRQRIPPELALVAYLDKHPEQAAHLLAGDEPISIEPISIPELP